MNFYINITFSKLMALMILILAFLMDFKSDKGGTVLMYAIPFIVVLVTGKQAIDMQKADKKNIVNKNNQ